MVVFVVGIGDAEIAEDLILTRFQSYLAVAENDVIFVICDSVASVFEPEDLSLADTDDETIVTALASRVEGVVAVAADHPAVIQFEQQEYVGNVVDELVEIDLALRIPTIQQSCPFYLQMLLFFDGLYEELTDVGLLCKNFVGEVDIVVSR